MPHRLSSSLFAALLLFASAAAPFAGAQVVRFETTVGSFDMVLNPTNNPLLQEHVDNMLNYVEDGAYKSSWINRAAEGFVLQMGGFYSHTKRVPIDIASTRPVATFAPIAGEPAAENPGLSNTLGTVSLALPGNGAGGTNQDGGTSSFFVNLTDNSFLDADFTVFAAIPDMTTVNNIMGLMQTDLTADPDFGAGAGNLGFSDVPLEDNGFQVFIRRAYVIDDTLAVARDMAGVRAVMAASLGGGSGSTSPATMSSLSLAAVPEPATATILLAGLASLALRRRRFA
jgi:peptidyl-prolyl cis-trans isomerase B (cyclophilin B)